MTVAPLYKEYADVESTGIRVPLALPPPPRRATTVDAAAAIDEGGGTNQAAAAAAAGQGQGEGEGEGEGGRGHHIGQGGGSRSSNGGGVEEEAGEEEGEGQEEEAYACSTSGGPGNCAELHLCRQGGVDRVFVECPGPFASTKIYEGKIGGGKGSLTYMESGSSPDLDLRYSVLCQGALAAPVLLWDLGGDGVQPSPQLPVVFVANDWPGAPLVLRLQHCIQGHCEAAQQLACLGSWDGCLGSGAELAELQLLLQQQLARASAVLCIHNLAYQGVFDAGSFPRLCLPPTAAAPLCEGVDWRHSLRQKLWREQWAAAHQWQQGEAAGAARLRAWREETGEGREAGGHGIAVEPAATGCGTSAAWVDAGHSCCLGGRMNFMRAGLIDADAVVTVSPNYAVEITEDEGMGCGLRALLAEKGVT